MAYWCISCLIWTSKYSLEIPGSTRFPAGKPFNIFFWILAWKRILIYNSLNFVSSGLWIPCPENNHLQKSIFESRVMVFNQRVPKPMPTEISSPQNWPIQNCKGLVTSCSKQRGLGRCAPEAVLNSKAPPHDSKVIKGQQKQLQHLFWGDMIVWNSIKTLTNSYKAPRNNSCIEGQGASCNDLPCSPEARHSGNPAFSGSSMSVQASDPPWPLAKSLAMKNVTQTQKHTNTNTHTHIHTHTHPHKNGSIIDRFGTESPHVLIWLENSNLRSIIRVMGGTPKRQSRPEMHSNRAQKINNQSHDQNSIE